MREGVNIEHGAYFDSGSEIEIGNNSGLALPVLCFNLKGGEDVRMGPELALTGKMTSSGISNCQCGCRARGIKSSVHRRRCVDWDSGIILPGITIGRGAIICVVPWSRKMCRPLPYVRNSGPGYQVS